MATKKIFCVLIFVSIVATVSFASPASVTTVNSQTKYGTVTNIYFETAALTAGSAPSPNSAFTQSGSSGSYSMSQSSVAYLWSPQFGTPSTMNAGNWVLGLWAASVSYVLSYVTITITNSQTSATPASLQEKITWNPSSYTNKEAANLGNIRFYSDSAFTLPLYAWLESCTPSLSNTATSATAWVKLTGSIAPSEGQLIIYMAFLSTAASFDGVYWGKAPNLSGTYGAYDNGINVFSFYDNFAGTTLNTTKWTQVKSPQGSVALNNGATFTANAGADWVYLYSSPKGYPFVAEAYMVSANNDQPLLGVSTWSSSNNYKALYNGYSLDWNGGHDRFNSQISSGSHLISDNKNVTSFPAGIWSVYWAAVGNEGSTDGAGNSIALTDATVNAIANYGLYVGTSNQKAGSNVVQWARMRAFPPNNVMPAASFGSVSVNSISNVLSMSIFVTDSSGNIQITVASNVQSPAIGSSMSQYGMMFDGSQVTVPQNGYIAVSFSAIQNASYTVYWGNGQPTNFQVPYRVLSFR